MDRNISKSAPAKGMALAQDANEAGVFKLAGTDSTWIWVHTCPNPECPCRAATILATFKGRAHLIEHGAAAHEIWKTEGDFCSLAGNLGDLIVFCLDMDTLQVTPAYGFEAVDLPLDVLVNDIVDRIDIDLLDAIEQLWFSGKGRPDPESIFLGDKEIIVGNWQRYERLPWSDICAGSRQDQFPLEGRIYGAFDSYCSNPNCNCQEVFIEFETVDGKRGHYAGYVRMHLSGDVEIMPHGKGRGRLVQLWAAYQRRQTNYFARLSRRHACVKSLGTRIVGANERESAEYCPSSMPAIASKPTPKTAPTQPRIGRNDPCPCGSGKKYKKCCDKNI